MYITLKRYGNDVVSLKIISRNYTEKRNAAVMAVATNYLHVTSSCILVMAAW